MKRNLIAGLAVIATATQLGAQPTFVSVIQNSPNQTNTVHIADFQYVKVVTAVDQLSGGGFVGGAGTITLGGVSFQIPTQPNGDGPFATATVYPSFYQVGSLIGLALAGPADVTVISSGATRSRSTPLLVTLEIGPGAYSVTNSVTLGPGQGAAITLESSPDLVNWTAATNGVYTVPAAMFFRLHLQRVQ